MLVVFASGIRITSLGAPLFFDLPLGVLSVPFTLLFIMTLINAFNLTDGIDGLAGGLALLSLVAMAIVGINTDVFSLIVLLIAVVLAFLLFNFPMRFVQPVRTFMGDAGSTFLGLAIASIGVWLSQGIDPRISPVVGLWFVAVPVFDLFSTIIRRSAEGKSPFAPDHGHLHHVLMDCGLSRRATLAWMLMLAGVCVVDRRARRPIRRSGRRDADRLVRCRNGVLPDVAESEGHRGFDRGRSSGRQSHQAWSGLISSRGVPPPTLPPITGRTDAPC